MIEMQIEFDLPLPWLNKKFQSNKFSPINFLVGPNGSGKSQFSRSLKSFLPGARLLGTDRLSGMAYNTGLEGLFGDNFASGFAKNYFDHLKQAAQQGSGIDTVILLEERLELRIQVEATLSHLFNRAISLEWDSGNLLARATHGGTGASYRLDRDECHGIKELLVLLTHLYNDENPYLIIDEPELNLHPQYQAFFMQEVRKVAGDPSLTPEKKMVFLITHSPFMLDFRSIDDVKAVLSFDLAHSIPRKLPELDNNSSARLSSIVPRLNVHHKQLFFSDNPVFVEGILDAQFIGALQNARGVSIAAAGSCIIDAGGCEEVNRYLELCLAFGKQAHFLYDLDSLFSGNLRACVKGDGTVQSFLASSGVGNDFAKYCGELDRKLTELIDRILTDATSTPSLSVLLEFLNSLGDKKNWTSKHLARARVALLTAISRNRGDMVLLLSSADINDVEGRLSQITSTLAQKNIHLLAGGTLERYLPAYTADPYRLEDEAKRRAVNEEIIYLASAEAQQNIKGRYGELYEAICQLPTKVGVDVEPVLRRYLGQYIHNLQTVIVANPAWDIEKIGSHMAIAQRETAKLFTLEHFVRIDSWKFQAVIVVSRILGSESLRVNVDHQTNAGMGNFRIDSA